MWKELLEAGLNEDHWQWDWTTRGAVGARSRPCVAKVVAKSEGIWAAADLVGALPMVAREQGYELTIRTALSEGQRFRTGQVVCAWRGHPRMVLALERPFLNLAAYVSGIATTTRALVDRVKSTWKKIPVSRQLKNGIPRVTATRKTLPLYRDLAIHGVVVGGGWSHRLGLSSGILIKENHIEAAGGIARATEGVRRIAPHGLKLEIEVKSIEELREALRSKADGVLLDNFTPAKVQAALTEIRKSGQDVFVEVSGGLNERTIANYVIPGVDILSVGALTHSPKAADLSLLVGR